MSKCNYCKNNINQDCHQCNNESISKFIPIDEISQYFQRVSYGFAKEYQFMSKPNMKGTCHIQIGSRHYCAYCGDTSYKIDTVLPVTESYICFCPGARYEVEYNQKAEALRQEYEAKLDDLQDEYKSYLEYNTEKLFQRKQELDERRFDKTRKIYPFSTLNGLPIKDIEYILR